MPIAEKKSRPIKEMVLTHESGAINRREFPDHVWWKVELQELPYFCHTCETMGKVSVMSNIPLDEFRYLIWVDHAQRCPDCGDKFELSFNWKLGKTNEELAAESAQSCP